MISYFSKLLYILPSSKKRLFCLILLFLLSSVLETFGIGLIGPFIALASNPDIIHQNYWLNLAYEQLQVRPESHFIALAGLSIILIFCIKSYISWRIQSYVFTYSYTQQGLLTAKLMRTYLNAPYTFHLQKSSVHIIQNVIQETKEFSNSVLITFLTCVSNLIVVFTLGVLLSITNVVTVLAILGLALPLFVLLNSLKDKIRFWGKEASQSSEEIIRIINHGLGGIKETKIIGCYSYFETQISKQSKRYVDATSGFFAFKLLPRVLVETFLVIFLIGLVSVFLLTNQNIQSLISILSVFVLASIRLIPAFSNFAAGISTLRNSSYIVSKLYFDLKEIGIEKNSKNLFFFPNEKSTYYESNNQQVNFIEKVVLEGVHYYYPNTSENTLNNITLTIQKGQSIAFIGKSGAGKTTLVDVILGLLIPQQGDIQVDGVSIYDDLRFWQNLIAYIPQSIFLIDDTIKRNIAFGVPDHLIDEEKLHKAIQIAQLEELIEGLPDGTQTMVGERGVLLSGGQRQRIGIARALYHEREILILDEATAALDNETEGLITKAMQSLSGIKTLIIIAHRLSTIEHCDCVYQMDKGQIVKFGSYRSVV